MKRGLYLVLIYLLIFRTQQKNEKTFEAKSKDKIDLNNPVYKPPGRSNGAPRDSLINIRSIGSPESITADNVSYSPAPKETAKPLLAQW